jgi:hypothetical protein
MKGAVLIIEIPEQRIQGAFVFVPLIALRSQNYHRTSIVKSM